MGARERILRKLGSIKPQLPNSGTASIPPPTEVQRDERLARFLVEAAALGVECHVADSVEDVQHRLRALVQGLRVLSWDVEHLPYDGGRALTNACFARAPRSEQARAEVGVTGCDVAIAETGSLVLFSAPGRSRAVSLLPPFHIVLVEPDKLCFSMAEMFVAQRQRIQQAASCTVITGPSRTADIELTLTLGIHGPGRVAVIVGPAAGR